MAQAVTAEAGTVGTAEAGTVGTAEAGTAEMAGAGQGNRPPCFLFSHPFAQETKVMTATGQVVPIVWNMKREIPCVCPSL
ncbi:hypothetical protein BN2476_110001 [Paraburkholderia piptadeniae]|uniref:Uncharacterized protein n=1 Tax=Paraburkholderia piptadeniae TaxID=1701573 RepID=A0A1N7RP58_9BURK|nr:hypothetical protein BN2476_110001 [Paraburkholderia piptadeniae]